MDIEEKQCIFPPIVSPRKLKYTGTYSFKKSSGKEESEITLKHALFEMDATFHELQRSFDDFKYELENGIKKSKALEKYTGLIEEIHNEVPLLQGKDIENSSTIGECKKLKEHSGGKGRKIITYTDWFKREMETGKDEERFSKEYEKTIKKELQVIYQLDKQIKEVEKSFKEMKEENTLCGKWEVIQNLSKNSNYQSGSKLFKRFRNMEVDELGYECESKYDHLEEETVLQPVRDFKEIERAEKPNEEETETKSEQNRSVQEIHENKTTEESKEDTVIEHKSKNDDSQKSYCQSFIHRNIELAKSYSTVSVPLTDEEKSRLETLLSEIDENEDVVNPYQLEQLNSSCNQQMCTADKSKVKTKERHSLQTENDEARVFPNAFRLSDEDQKALNEIERKLSGISGTKSTLKLDEEAEIEEKILEDEKHGKLWKHEQLQLRLDQIEQRLANLTAIEANDGITNPQNENGDDLEPSTTTSDNSSTHEKNDTS
ncbi:J protein JJJ1-like [Agrilus planipennis]|uniref:J protein JJJ1-like n=1 Tax=Agrilus planipennis TaxID=224129 RepID=A0A1W4WMH8_AGRPL|nr:J protein JJJ1-like [Agrilus planipennis]